MKKTEFPKAKDYVHSVNAVQIAAKRLAISEQLSTIAKALTYFNERCDLDGMMVVDVTAIGDIIYQENFKVINDSGWQCHKRGTKWFFYITSQQEV